MYMNQKDARELSEGMTERTGKVSYLCLMEEWGYSCGLDLKNIMSFAKVRNLKCALLETFDKSGKWKKVRKKAKPIHLATYKSHSNPDVTYHILRATNGALECTCPGWQYRQKCWHMDSYRIGK